LNRIYEQVRQIWEEERIPERNNNISYTQKKEIEVGVRITGE